MTEKLSDERAIEILLWWANGTLHSPARPTNPEDEIEACRMGAAAIAAQKELVEAARILGNLAILNLHSLSGCVDDSIYGEYRAWLVRRGEMTKNEEGKWSIGGFVAGEEP